MLALLCTSSFDTRIGHYLASFPFVILHASRGVLSEKNGGGVRPASQDPYLIYDQNQQFSLPYLWTFFMNWPLLQILFQICIRISSLVQTNIKGVLLIFFSILMKN